MYSIEHKDNKDSFWSLDSAIFKGKDTYKGHHFIGTQQIRTKQINTFGTIILTQTFQDNLIVKLWKSHFKVGPHSQML